MLLSAEHLSINFGSRQLLEDVNFYLNGGRRPIGITVAADSQTVRTFCEKQRAARKESGIHNCGTQRQRKGRRRCKTVKKTAG